MSHPALASFLLLAVGCAAPPLDGAAVVILSPSAHKAGVLLDLDMDAAEPMLPRLVPADAPLKVMGPQGDLSVELSPASAVLIAADDGKNPTATAYEVGDEVSEQAIRIDASATAAHDLADQIGAELEPEGRGSWLLVGGDALLLAATAEEADGFHGASLVFTDEPLPESVLERAGLSRPSRAAALWPARPRAWVGAEAEPWLDRAEQGRETAASNLEPGSLNLRFDEPVAGLDRVPWVGLYCGDGPCLMLDAEGSYATCEGSLDQTLGAWTVQTGALLLRPWDGEIKTLRAATPGALFDEANLPLRRETCPSDLSPGAPAL